MKTSRDTCALLVMRQEALIRKWQTWSSWTEKISISPSYLLSGNAHVVRHVGENRRLNEEALQAQSFASTLQLGSFTDAALDVFQHTILLLPADLLGRRTGT